MKSRSNIFLYIFTALALSFVIAGCTDDASKVDSNTSAATLRVDDNDYRYYDVEQVGGTYKYMVAPDTGGLKTFSLSNPSGVTSTAIPTHAKSDRDLSKIATFSLAANSAKNALAVGTYEGLYIFTLGSYGDLLSATLYEGSDLYSGTGLNNHVASVTYDADNLIVGLRRGRVAIAKVDTNGQITSGFTTYDKNSTLNLRLLRDVEVYNDKAVILAKKLVTADYNATAGTLSNFVEVDDANLDYAYVTEIAMDKNNSLMLLPSTRGLIVAKLDSNGTFTKIKRYTDSELPSLQYQSADFSSDGKKIAVGAMGKGIVIADVDSNGTISNITDLNASMQKTNNTAILAIKFSDDDKFVLATSDDQSITVINVSQITGGN